MVEVKICIGTACYVMGGANFLLIKEKLSDKERKKVKLEFVPCLGYCKSGKGKPPFVLINGKIYEKIVDVDALIEIIRENIEK